MFPDKALGAGLGKRSRAAFFGLSLVHRERYRTFVRATDGGPHALDNQDVFHDAQDNAQRRRWLVLLPRMFRVSGEPRGAKRAARLPLRSRRIMVATDT